MVDVFAESGPSRPLATADIMTPQNSLVNTEKTPAEIEIIEGIKAGDPDDQNAKADNTNKDIEASGDIQFEERGRPEEYYFQRSYWIPRFEQLLRKLLDSENVSYARLLALYTGAMLPISQSMGSEGVEACLYPAKPSTISARIFSSLYPWTSSLCGEYGS
ncbi:hypothetical protein BGZ60DRAFT_37891 [Tricladium varicosporioides]|nr:hypothetical protein BGZ60DRAFT_37891 [Hymenoscyphus varicosporioides]